MEVDLQENTSFVMDFILFQVKNNHITRDHDICEEIAKRVCYEMLARGMIYHRPRYTNIPGQMRGQILNYLPCRRTIVDCVRKTLLSTDFEPSDNPESLDHMNMARDLFYFLSFDGALTTDRNLITIATRPMM
jgi:hypothetical protein